MLVSVGVLAASEDTPLESSGGSVEVSPLEVSPELMSLEVLSELILEDVALEVISDDMGLEIILDTFSSESLSWEATNLLGVVPTL